MFAKVSAWLKPTPLVEKDRARVARTLTILLVVVMVGAAILSVVRLFSGEMAATLYAAIILFVSCAFLLVLVRRGQYTFPSYATPILILFLFVYAISQDQGLHDIGMPALSLAIVLAAMMLGRRGAVLLTILTMLSVVALGVAEMTGQLESALSATTGPDDIFIVALSFGFIGFVISIMVGNLSDSLREAREANSELQALSATLENKVADRVKDLSLAASVSATLSQEGDLDTLLPSAANLIQQKFGLYYAQIYLMNKGSVTLQLRAGSGSMGQELVRRGHRLMVGPGSINGVAVAERRPILVPDTGLNPVFRSNTLLPLTRSEIAVPLLVGEQVLGVLNLQSNQVEGLNENRLPAFEILGNQLAIAIENTILLAETQAARAEMEAYARGVAQKGWDSYLNAVDRPRFMGYRYDGREIRPLAEPLGDSVDAERNVAQTPIDIVGQSIGAIQVEADADHYWTEEDLDFIQSVAQKVGQQVEVLRSLDEAAYYRHEAEGALRRLTQEAWREHQTEFSGAEGFIYDSTEVRPLTSQAIEESGLLLRQTLRVGDEVIGELALGKEGEYDPVEALEITAVVAQQLSQHLENLRLSATTEKALDAAQQRSYQLSILNTLVTKLSQASGLRESMQIIVEQMADALRVRQVRVALLNEQKNALVIVAEKYDAHTSPSALDITLPVQGNPLTEMVIASRKTAHVPNVYNSPLTVPILDILKEQGIFGLTIMPILLNDTVVGTLGIDLLEEDASLASDQLELAEAILRQASTAIEKARLFEQTQARAEELEAINQIAQIVARQSDREQLLHTVYEQVRRIMPVDAYYVALYDADNHLMEFPLIYDEGEVYQEMPAPPSPNSRVYEVVRTGEALLINRTAEEIAALEAERSVTTVGDPTRVSASLLFVPLRIGQEVVGVLSVQSYKMDAYEQPDMTLLAGIASHVAVALDNARLLAQSSARVQEGQILQALASSINTAVDAESVLRTAAKEIGRALGLQTYVYLQDPAAEDSPEVLAVPGMSGKNGR
jgi:GAF domain-containing protein